jgi:hypothetical protein
MFSVVTSTECVIAKSSAITCCGTCGKISCTERTISWK